MNIKKILIPDKNRKNYFYLNAKGCQKYREDKRIYKYINLDSAVLCLSNRSIRFVQPTAWQDKYEMRFYRANYAKLNAQPMLHPDLYACCFTTKDMSEAAWKVYVKENSGLGSHCVKFELRLNKLRDILSAYGENNNCLIYESQMIYSLTDDEINNIHHYSSSNYKELFENFNLESYLTLLSIKRPAFSYENELRFFIIPQNQNDIKIKNELDINISWGDITTKISIDEKCSSTENMILADYWNRMGQSDIIIKENLYRNPDRNITIDGHNQLDDVLEIIENNSGLSTVAICETIGESKMKVQAILKKYANEGIINYNITENGKEWFIVK